MKGLKVALWISAIGCLLGVPFIFLPWGVIENFVQWFGLEPVPGNDLVIYIFRVVCGISGLIGIYFIILARNPFAYGPMLKLAAYGLIIFGLMSLITGLSLGMPLHVYAGDTLFGLVLGILITVLSSQKEDQFSTV